MKGQDCYVAVFLSRNPGLLWPYDFGDDPSFHSSLLNRGNLTWGVCRPNVRNPLNVGDLVVFVSNSKDGSVDKYRLACWATVAKKISQMQIWEDPEFCSYQKYSNLLMRNREDGMFEHYEPSIPKGQWHKNWIKRLIEGRLTEKQKQIQKRQTFSGEELHLAQNYILFNPEGAGTTILANPPLIAKSEFGQNRERWLETEEVQDLKTLIISPSTHRTSLRTSAQGFQHPPIQYSKINPSSLFEKLNDWSCRLGHLPRAVSSSGQIRSTVSQTHRGAGAERQRRRICS